MDHFFARILLLGETANIGLSMALTVVGGLIAAWTIEVHITLRRVAYLWCIALLGLAVVLAQTVWLEMNAAAEAGLFSLLAIVAFGSFAVFGAGLYYVSAARSRNIDGETSRAWLGFVPFANLWLIFTSPKDHTETAAERSKIARYLLDPVLVIGALFVFGIGQVVTTALDRAVVSGPPTGPALSEIMAGAQDVEDMFIREERLSRADLPVRIDEITILRDVEADGRVLRLLYDVERQIDGLRADFKTILAAEQCAPEMFGPAIARGGTVELVYRGPDGGTIASYRIIEEDCA